MDPNRGQTKYGFQYEISIARRIDTIGDDPLKPQSPGDIFAIDRQRCPGQSRRPQTAQIHSAAAIRQSLAVPLKFLAVGQPHMGRKYRLGPLQMGVGRDDHPFVSVAATDKRDLKRFQQPVDSVNRISYPQSQIGRDLIVATSPRMEFATNIANSVNQRLFNIHMNIFKFFTDLERSVVQLPVDLGQLPLNLVALIRTQDLLVCQHFRMGNASSNIVMKEPLVKTDTFSEGLDPFVYGGVKRAAAAGTRQNLPLFHQTWF